MTWNDYITSAGKYLGSEAYDAVSDANTVGSYLGGKAYDAVNDAKSYLGNRVRNAVNDISPAVEQFGNDVALYLGDKAYDDSKHRTPIPTPTPKFPPEGKPQIVDPNLPPLPPDFGWNQMRRIPPGWVPPLNVYRTKPNPILKI